MNKHPTPVIFGQYSRIFGFFLLFLALSPALSAQETQPDLSSIDRQMEELQSLIDDTLNNEQQQIQRLNDLSQILAENERLLSERETLLQTLKVQLADLSETYKMQANLSRKYERSSRFWRTCTLVGIPAAVAISAGVTAAILARK
jgi:septal ring factor EnvC (AmiA/AmiB activator)